MRRGALIVALMLARAAAGQAPAAAPEPAPIDDEIVIRGVRTGVFEALPAASRDVIFTDDYAAENKDLAELLAEAPGVNVRRFGGPGDRAELSIRGSTPQQVVVAIDGVRANSALTGGLDLSRVCLPLLEQVEITRGAGAAQYGSGAVGGVVNLVTRAGATEPTTRAELSAGSFESVEGSLLHAGESGAFDYSLGYCGFGTEGDFEFRQPIERGEGGEARFDPERATRLNNEREQHGATLGLGAELGPGTLRLSDYFVHSRGGEPGFDGANGPTAGQRTEAHSRDLANLAQLRWDGTPPEPFGDELALSLYHRYERSAFRDPAVVPGDPIDVSARLQTLGARVRDVWHAEPFAQSLSLGLQLDGAHDRLRGSDPRGRERESGAVALDPTLRLFGARLLLSAAARVDWTEGFEPELLPSLGLVVTPLRWLRLRGQLGRAYRAPSFDELFHPDEGFIRGNPGLEPEDAWNADAGGEIQLAQLGPASELRLGASWFRREIDDSIVWLLLGSSTLSPINTGSATAEGYELSASLRLTRFARLSFQHTRTDSRRDATGRRLPGQPDRESFGRLELGPSGVWKLVGEVQRVGEILVNEGGGRRIERRTVWNASAALNLVAWPGFGLGRVVSELWIYTEWNNLGDVAVRDSVAFPQPGRNASAGFEARW